MSGRKKQTKRTQCRDAGTRMFCLHCVWSSFHWNQGTHSHLLFSKGRSVLEERVRICQDILEAESVSLPFSPLPHPLPVSKRYVFSGYRSHSLSINSTLDPLVIPETV